MVNYPAYSEISAITNAQNAVVTFTEDHDFTVGQIVSFRVGKLFGMEEINNKRTRVIDTSSDTITTELDTTNWTPFTLSLLYSEGTSPPVCVPSSSGVVPNLFTPEMNIKDAFDTRS